MAKNEPGRDPEMVSRTRALNVVFALTSLGLLVVLSLMVWADYDRPWKKYQKEFTTLEQKRTEEQIQQALGKVDAARKQQIEAQLAKGEQEAAQNADGIRQAEAEVRKLHDEWYRVDQDFRFTKARIDVARFEAEEAAHQGKSNAGSKQKALQDLEQRWNELRLQLEDVIARRAAAQKRVADLEKDKLEAETARKELYKESKRLEDRLAAIEPGFVYQVRNLPVLDLANPSLRINQIMPANLYDDVIFSPTPKVDRCTTCHLAIDKKGYEKAPQPYTTHPNLETYLQGPHPIDRIGCTACHQGRGRATSFQKAAHTASSVEQEKAWGKYIGHEHYEAMHYWDLPMMAKGQTEAQCAKCHQGVVEVPQAQNLNTGRFLVERYGCYGCHKIKGWEGLRKVGPDLAHITAKTDPEWMFRWIKEPKGFRPTRMPQIWDVRVDETAEQKKRNDVEINSVVAYLEANSQAASYPAPPAGDLSAGRKTFETIGCLGCHRVGDDKRGMDAFWAASYRTHGPNLDGTGSKVNAGWLFAWVRNPKGYWHQTRMPNLRLTDKEAADVTAYLMSLKNDEFRARPRPPLDAAIRDAAIKEHLLASSVAVKQADAQIAAMNDQQRTLFLGERTILRYGCFGCHEIKGFEKANAIGTELTEEGSKMVERLDFGYEHGQIPHTLPGWVHRKLMEPRVFDRAKVKRPEELLRMPKFHFDEAEAGAIVTAVMSFSKEQVPAAAQKVLSADERYAEKGLRLVRDYNCRGCHQVGTSGGGIRKVIEAQLEESGGDVLQAQALSAPMLYNAVSKIGEGSRVHTDWLHGFLSDPSNHVRPWLDLRMPTFEFDQEQLNTITHGFASLDKVPFPYAPRPVADAETIAHGRDLFTRWQCVKCHVVAGKLPEGQEPANMAPDLAKVPERLRPDWLTLWLKNPAHIQPGTRMPTNFPEKADENAFPDVLGGDQARQVEAVRAYLLTLGRGGAQVMSAAPAPGKAGGR
jgi:cytochrome c2